jgi:glycosyltransferase involved in cell wall biosynthesis
LGELQAVLEQAFLLVHPTREDSSPLVISEAGYFGCPSISVNQFAIPELIRHGETGLLLEPPVQAERLATAIESLIQHPEAYRVMRRKARAYALEHANWDVIGEKMACHIESCLALQKTGKQASTG